jgi:hypothetical protein
MQETVKVNKQEVDQELKSQTYPANVVELPSKGLLYDPENPLSTGKVEMKFMTAKEENILTTESYIKDGTVIDRLLQSLVISPKFDYDTLLIGDKDALIIASRIYGYGENYDIKVKAPSGKDQETTINLSELPNKEFDETLYANGNRFEFVTPLGKNKIVFKLLTVGDQKQIDAKLKKYRKAGSPDTQITTRLGQMIISVDGNEDPFYIKLFVENDLRAPDSRALREYVAKVQCGVNMEIELVDEETSEPFRTNIAIGSDFFWPDSRV